MFFCTAGVCSPHIGFKRCENAFVEFMCNYLQPICIIESLSFLKLVSTLDPWYIPVSHTTFTRVKIPAKYTSVKKLCLLHLQQPAIAHWPLDWVPQRAYMVVTINYITSEWEMKHRCLQTHKADERHTSENLVIKLQMVFKVLTFSWGWHSCWEP